MKKKLLILLPALAMIAGGCKTTQKEHVHSLQRHDAVASTCIKQGTIEYWSCECGAKFSDENGKNAVTSVDAPLASHKSKKVDAVAPSCVKDGNIQYWTCEVCDKKFSDEACSKEITGSVVDPKKGHSLVHHEAVAGDCQTKGTIEYWSCNNCEEKFADAEGKTVITSIEGEYGNHKLNHHEAVAGKDCQTKGTIEYWDCSVCSKKFSDAEGENEITSIEGDVGDHKLNHHEAVAGKDCQTKGTIEYWDCSVCSKKFSDAEGENEITSIEGEYGDHKLNHHEAVAGKDCQTKGTIEYWDCSVCSKKFSDAEGENEITSIEGEYGNHTLSHHVAQNPTCVADGNIEHWTCDVCSKYFLDENAKNETTAAEVVVATEGHKWKESYSKDATDHWFDCNNCTEIKEKAAHKFEGHEFIADGNKVMKRCSVCGDVQIDTATPISLGMGYTDSAGFHYNILGGVTDPFDTNEAFTPINPEVINTNLSKMTFQNRNTGVIVSIFATLTEGAFIEFTDKVLVKKAGVYYALDFVGQAFGSGKSREIKNTFDVADLDTAFGDGAGRVFCFKTVNLGYSTGHTTLSWTVANNTYWKIQKVSGGVTTDIATSPTSNGGMPAGPVTDIGNKGNEAYITFKITESEFVEGDQIVIKAGSAFVYKDGSGYSVVTKDIVIEKSLGKLVCVKNTTEFDNQATVLEHWDTNIGQLRISNFDLIPNYSENGGFTVDAYFGVKYQKAGQEAVACTDLDFAYWNYKTTLTGFWIKKANGGVYAEGDKLIFEAGALFHCSQNNVGEFGKFKNAIELQYTSGQWALV